MPEKTLGEVVAGDLLSWGFPAQYAEGVVETMGFEDDLSEETLQAWVADLGGYLDVGSWFVLAGGVGIGKTFAMARIALALRRRCPGFMWDYADSGQRWSNGQRAFLEFQMPRPWFGSEVRYVLSTDLADMLVEWDMASAKEPTAALGIVLQARCLFVDDIDRWFELTLYDRNRGRILYRWDEVAELRSGPGMVTVVTANRTEDELQKVPEFERWLSRVRKDGQVLTIPGEDRRGRLLL